MYTSCITEIPKKSSPNPKGPKGGQTQRGQANHYSKLPNYYDPYRRAWAAILLRAIKDYTKQPGDLRPYEYHSAAEFLASDNAEFLIDALDLAHLPGLRLLRANLRPATSPEVSYG